MSRWGRGDGGKRRKEKQKRDSWGRELRRKKEEKRKENGGEIGQSIRARRW